MSAYWEEYVTTISHLYEMEPWEGNKKYWCVTGWYTFTTKFLNMTSAVLWSRYWISFLSCHPEKYRPKCQPLFLAVNCTFAAWCSGHGMFCYDCVCCESSLKLTVECKQATSARTLMCCTCIELSALALPSNTLNAQHFLPAFWLVPSSWAQQPDDQLSSNAVLGDCLIVSC